MAVGDGKRDRTVLAATITGVFLLVAAIVGVVGNWLNPGLFVDNPKAASPTGDITVPATGQVLADPAMTASGTYKNINGGVLYVSLHPEGAPRYLTEVVTGADGQWHSAIPVPVGASSPEPRKPYELELAWVPRPAPGERDVIASCLADSGCRGGGFGALPFGTLVLSSLQFERAAHS
jgi:hypothetical protein